MLGPSTFLPLPLVVDEVVGSVEETGGGVSRICVRELAVSAGPEEGEEKADLVVAEPDLAVSNGEVENVVDERLCPPRRLGHRKDLLSDTPSAPFPPSSLVARDSRSSTLP